VRVGSRPRPFVGFGALIAVRSGGANDAQQVAYVRSMVSISIWVAVTALAPVTLGEYGFSGHQLWLASSLLGIVLIIGVWAANYRTPEMRQELTAAPRVQTMRVAAVELTALVTLLGALVLVVLGVVPDQEPALYLTAVQLGLFISAMTLLFLVFSQRRSQEPSTTATTTGGSNG
jgi:hypothetical protein